MHTHTTTPHATAKEAIIIDPVDLTVDRDVQVLEEMGVTLKYAVYVRFRSFFSLRAGPLPASSHHIPTP